jgi:carboxypeptidase C (cathepsin A)
MRSRYLVALFAVICLSIAVAQQSTPAKNQKSKQPAAAQPSTQPAETKPPETAPSEQKPESARPPSATGEPGKAEPAEHYDMAEVAPVVTHHQVTVGGKLLKYTATAGRLPIKRDDGKIEAEMFFVAYTLDGQDASKRPLTFAFNGGPGSASIWLHMGALGPKRVVLKPDGFMPASPYRSEDNQYTSLDKTDLVMVDAIGTGFSRAATSELSKKFWGVKGDIEAFGEFIRLYLTRYERWTSPLYMLGESYGTTRAAGISGYLAEHGISFNGIILLSTVLNFETLEFTKTNDLPYELILPSYTTIAAYHKKLAPDLMQDLAKTRQQVEQWVSTDYKLALAKGDALAPADRQKIVDQMARYTGLSKEVVDQANLRIDVRAFTHYLLIDRKLRVGRLDGRFTGPDPNGLMDTPFYDPTSSAILPPFTSVFNNYVRTELGYKTDTPYRVFAFEAGSGFERWDWGSAIEGFPDTATALRQALTKNPYLKVLVMEGNYDLATPYYAAWYTFDHLDLSADLRKNLSFTTYDAGHMVYVQNQSLAKFKGDVAKFIDQTTAQ